MSCDECNGLGWLIVVRNGFSGAERCDCSIPPPRTVTPTSYDDCIDAVLQLSGMNISFFPGEHLRETMAFEFLARFPDRDDLKRFVRAGWYSEKWQGIEMIWAKAKEMAEAEAGRAQMDADTARIEQSRRAHIAAGGTPFQLAGRAPLQITGEVQRPPERDRIGEEMAAWEAGQRLKDTLTPPQSHRETKPVRELEIELALAPRHYRTQEENNNALMELEYRLLEIQRTPEEREQLIEQMEHLLRQLKKQRDRQ